MTGKTEQHEWQFGDQKIPARVWYLAREGRVSLTDLILLNIIECLVKHQGEENGLGCFASNAYLAKAANIHPNYVTERVRKLNEEGLLLIVYLDGQRYLEPEWARTAEERSALEGDYGIAYRKAYRKLLKRLGIDTAKVVGGSTGKAVSPPTRKPVHIVVDTDLKKKTIDGGLAAKRGSTSPANNGSSKRTLTTPNIPQFCFDWQARLRKILRSKKPVIPISQGSRESWADQFRKLWKKLHEDQDRINRLLDWYELNINEIDRPTISSAKQFCSDSIFSWLEGLMNPRRKNYSETDKDNRRSYGTSDRLQEHEKT